MALVICIFLSLCVSVFGISTERQCADAKCEVPISSGVAKFVYVPSETDKIVFKKGDTLTVYSKEAGNDTSLWGIEVNGKRGYAPKSAVKELQVFHKKLNFTVPTKMENTSVSNLTDNDKPETKATEFISNSFSVVDGTTIYANTSGEILETQPLETIAISPQSVDIQSSTTIDATSISKNTLDEPNSSLILPQPTTSAPVYRANGDEFFGETQTESLEDIKKSSVETSDPEKNEGELGDPVVKDFENISGVKNVEENKMPENTEVRKEDTISKEEEGDGEEEGDEDEDMEEVDEEDEEFDTDIEDTEQDQEGEGQENDGNRDDGQSEKGNRWERDLRENTGIDLQGSNISGSELVDNSEESTVALEREQEGTSKEPTDPGSTEKSERDKVILDHNKLPSIVQTLGEAATASPFVINASQQNDLKHSESKNDSIVSGPDNNENKDIAHNTVVHEKEISSAKTSSENDVSLEFNSNLSKESEEEIGDLTSESSSTHIGLNTVNTGNIPEEKGVGEKEESFFNTFSSFGKVGEVEEGDANQATVQNVDVTVSSENSELQDVTAVVTENILIEQVPPANSFEEITNPYTTASPEEYTPVTRQDNNLQQAEDPESVVSTESDQYQNHDTSGSEENVFQDSIDDGKDDSKLEQMDTEETSPQVPDTCEMHSVGCLPESEDITEQHTSSEEAETGWFAFLTGRADLGSKLLSFFMSKDMQKNSFDTFLYLMVTAITVLVFSLGYYYIEKQRRDGSLIAKINSLEKALMVSSQEKYTLKDELESAKEKLSAFVTSVDSGETSSVLNDELEDGRNARIELEEQVAALEKELESATEAGLELNRMMSELLSAQHGSDTLMKSVEHLQKQLDSQQSTISTMTASLTAKNLENENLQSELKLASERSLNLEEQLAKVNETLMNLQKEKSEIEHDFQVESQSIETQLVEALENKSADSQRLCRELDALKDVLDETRKTLAARDGEVSILRECLSHAERLSNGGESNISFEEVLNVGHLRAKIDTVTKERDELQEKLQGEEDARKLLEDHMKIVSEEVSTLRVKYEEADRGKMEAQTRLEVLSNYFKEKETQLQKELGLQEAMSIQKEGHALSTTEQIKAFQEEIENYKAQNEILKKEILDQERSMKSQIAVLEKKTHENWVAARKAERRMDESKQEASQLRNRLTMSGRRLVGTIPGPDVIKPSERSLELEHNGEMSSSPAHMGETQEPPSSPHFGLPGSPPLLPPGGQPLPPGPFPGMSLFLPPGASHMPFPILPPPGGLFPDDLRLPPLGRMSSPPPEPRGSFSPFEHSPPLSPPSRPYRSAPHYEDSPSRYRHQTPPSSGTPSFSGPFSPGKWDERGDPPRSSFRPLHRDSPREPKGSTLSSGHSSESLDKGSRHSRV